MLKSFRVLAQSSRRALTIIPKCTWKVYAVRNEPPRLVTACIIARSEYHFKLILDHEEDSPRPPRS
jgi:hypothetical protein